MKDDIISIRLDQSLRRLLGSACKRSGLTRSQVIRDALKRQLCVQLFDDLSARARKYAEAKGVLEDEDVFKLIS